MVIPAASRKAPFFFLAVFVTAQLFLVSCRGSGQQEQADAQDSLLTVIEPNRYGFIDSGHIVDTLYIPANSTLSAILSGRGISNSHIAQLHNAMDSILPPRRIRSGQLSFFYLNRDSCPDYWIYRHSPTQFLCLNFTADTLTASLIELPVEKTQRCVHVTIESSLWNAMVAAQVSPQLALNLSDIYAWTVDFFGLATGDEFYALFDELSVDSTPIGIGQIHIARYVHGADTIRAYGYTQDSVFSYWDREGNSLRKAFLKAPLRFSRISSGFTYARKHPILKVVRPHTGIDYAAPAGTPVMALGDGTVIAKGYQNGGGNFVKIRHNSVYTTGYLHLSRFGKGIANGVRVQQGQTIGYVGSTGISTGPHLDFRVWKNGHPANPLNIESPSVEPIDSALRPDFLRCCDSLDLLLDQGLLSLRQLM